MGMSFRRLCIKNEKKWQTQVEEIKEDSSLSDQESSIPIDATTPKLEKYSHNSHTAPFQIREHLQRKRVGRRTSEDCGNLNKRK